VGTFPASLSAAAQAQDISVEVDAQVERAQACGIRLAYLEYAGRAHSAVDAALQQWSQRLGAPARMTSWGVKPLSLAEPTESAFRDALAALTPGAYLWLTHPAHDSPETWTLWAEAETAAARSAEGLALCSPEVRLLLEQRSIELVSFRQYLEERLGAEIDE
jgi:hypothetical protein